MLSTAQSFTHYLRFTKIVSTAQECTDCFPLHKALRIRLHSTKNYASFYFVNCAARLEKQLGSGQLFKGLEKQLGSSPIVLEGRSIHFMR